MATFVFSAYMNFLMMLQILCAPYFYWASFTFPTFINSRVKIFTLNDCSLLHAAGRAWGGVGQAWSSYIRGMSPTSCTASSFSLILAYLIIPTISAKCIFLPFITTS